MEWKDKLIEAGWIDAFKVATSVTDDLNKSISTISFYKSAENWCSKYWWDSDIPGIDLKWKRDGSTFYFSNKEMAFEFKMRFG